MKQMLIQQFQKYKRKWGVEYSLEKLLSEVGIIDFLDTDELINCRQLIHQKK